MSEACLFDWYSPCTECDRCYSKRNRTRVYCTNCNNFKPIENGDDVTPDCIYKNKCCLDNCEDSMSFEDRPHYEE